MNRYLLISLSLIGASVWAGEFKVGDYAPIEMSCDVTDCTPLEEPTFCNGFEAFRTLTLTLTPGSTIATLATEGTHYVRLGAVSRSVKSVVYNFGDNEQIYNVQFRRGRIRRVALGTASEVLGILESGYITGEKHFEYKLDLTCKKVR